jgi:hypothetical protein
MIEPGDIERGVGEFRRFLEAAVDGEGANRHTIREIPINESSKSGERRQPVEVFACAALSRLLRRGALVAGAMPWEMAGRGPFGAWSRASWSSIRTS